ncbi:THO complex subunit 4A [Tolypocladium capitatum]|uniref:THO complex subunit 4A n=1 Tax=Tolypocladium capitatum TaxID=45235 RepID=A0A2K3QPF6_9HYPO|nr:THO complex subunit 4A [Tolypocladium capitatum]
MDRWQGLASTRIARQRIARGQVENRDDDDDDADDDEEVAAGHSERAGKAELQAAQEGLGRRGGEIGIPAPQLRRIPGALRYDEYSMYEVLRTDFVLGTEHFVLRPLYAAVTYMDETARQEALQGLVSPDTHHGSCPGPRAFQARLDSARDRRTYHMSKRRDALVGGPAPPTCPSLVLRTSYQVPVCLVGTQQWLAHRLRRPTSSCSDEVRTSNTPSGPPAVHSPPRRALSQPHQRAYIVTEPPASCIPSRRSTPKIPSSPRSCSLASTGRRHSRFHAPSVPAMADKMDRGLDEIIADNLLPQRSNAPRNRRGGGDRRRERQDYPRDGVRKSMANQHLLRSTQSTRDEPRGGIDRSAEQGFKRTDSAAKFTSEWVHDRYEENSEDDRFFVEPTPRSSQVPGPRRPPAPRRRREDAVHNDTKGSKLRVQNIHYDLTEDDLDELFTRIGPVVRLQLLYDRAGRSEGTAYVTYETRDDAQEAVRQFDGANANGQPIRLTLMPSGPARNPFDSAVMPGRPLAERVSAPGGRDRSSSPHRRYVEDEAARKGIDRYIPGEGSRERSPMPRRRGGHRGGHRPGSRREGGREGGREGSVKDQQSTRGGKGVDFRSKKTQEELDAEMEDYFGGNNAPAAAEAEPANGAAPAAAIDDIDMIE